jgi:hypothetical protein
MADETRKPEYGVPDSLELGWDVYRSILDEVYRGLPDSAGTTGLRIGNGIMKNTVPGLDVVDAARNGTGRDVTVEVGGLLGDKCTADSPSAKTLSRGFTTPSQTA